MKTLTNKGFSLVEILLSITLLAILFAIIVTRANPRNIISITKDNEREADALSIYQALEQYTITNNAYPESVKSMPINSTLYICKTSAPSCTNSFGSNKINLSSILVPTYMSNIPEYSTDNNNSGFYIVKDNNGKIGIGGVKRLDETTFVKGLDVQAFNTSPLPIVENGLVLHLDAGRKASYPGKGTTLTDLSGNGNNATLVNGVEYNSANGGILVFNGEDNYGRVLDSDSLDFGNGNFTVSVWFKRYSNAINNLRLISKGATTDIANTDNAGFAFFGSDSFLAFLVNPTGTRVGPASISISLNTWTNATVVIDRGVSMRSYKNGILIGSSNSTPAGSVSGTSNLIIGAHLDGTALYWAGEISNISIYNQALTDQEIQQNFNATKGRFGL